MMICLPQRSIWKHGERTILSNTIDAGLQGGGLVNVFYQTGDGRFCHRSQTGTYDTPNRYLGEYLVTRFCPAENYTDISETVLTPKEAEQMIGKIIVIQRELFVTYDSESLREAVGEEYYEEINSVFYNSIFPWQQFYTLEGEDKLIMHSMLTGQNFILEKKETR